MESFTISEVFDHPENNQKVNIESNKKNNASTNRADQTPPPQRRGVVYEQKQKEIEYEYNSALKPMFNLLYLDGIHYKFFLLNNYKPPGMTKKKRLSSSFSSGGVSPSNSPRDSFNGNKFNFLNIEKIDQMENTKDRKRTSSGTTLTKTCTINRFSGQIIFKYEEKNIEGVNLIPLYGIIGTLEFFTGKVFIVVTKVEPVMRMDEKIIFRIKEIALLPIIGTKYEENFQISYNDVIEQLPEKQKKIQGKVYTEIKNMFETGMYYFSPEIDISNNLQYKSSHPEYRSLKLWNQVNDNFFYNKFMAQHLIDNRMDDFMIIVMQGFIQIRRCLTTNNNDYFIALISRRSRKRNGLRYKKRGIDDDGNCANVVETEQLIAHDNKIASFLQTRGSIPTYWSQPGSSYRPTPIIDENKTNAERIDVFQKHIADQQLKYGKQLIVNLVDHSGNEKVLSEIFLEIINGYRSQLSMPLDPLPHCQPRLDDNDNPPLPEEYDDSLPERKRNRSERKLAEMMREQQFLHSLSTNDLEVYDSNSNSNSNSQMATPNSKNNKDVNTSSTLKKINSEVCHNAIGKKTMMSNRNADELDHIVTRSHSIVSSSIAIEELQQLKIAVDSSGRNSPCNSFNNLVNDDYISTEDLQPVDLDVVYVSFDFHQHCSGTDYSKMFLLLKDLRPYLDCHGYCWIVDNEIQQLQTGVDRINCVDCLDRTNVVQSMIAKRQMLRILYGLGIIPMHEGGIPPESVDIFHDIWANNGDAISRLYSGTSALKGDFTRTGKRQFTGLLSDGVNSLTRFYNKHFLDGHKQLTVDILLGDMDINDFHEEDEFNDEEINLTAETTNISLSERFKNCKSKKEWDKLRESVFTQFTVYCKTTILSESENDHLDNLIGAWPLIRIDALNIEVNCIFIVSSNYFYYCDVDLDLLQITKVRTFTFNDVDYVSIGRTCTVGVFGSFTEQVQYAMKVNFKLKQVDKLQNPASLGKKNTWTGFFGSSTSPNPEPEFIPICAPQTLIAPYFNKTDPSESGKAMMEKIVTIYIEIAKMFQPEIKYRLENITRENTLASTATSISGKFFKK